MGIWETFTDLVEAATPWSTAEAEAPQSDATPDAPAKESVRLFRAIPSSLELGTTLV
jgi:hypothetical protein